MLLFFQRQPIIDLLLLLDLLADRSLTSVQLYLVMEDLILLGNMPEIIFNSIFLF